MGGRQTLVASYCRKYGYGVREREGASQLHPAITEAEVY